MKLYCENYGTTGLCNGSIIYTHHWGFSCGNELYFTGDSQTALSQSPHW